MYGHMNVKNVRRTLLYLYAAINCTILCGGARCMLWFSASVL